MFFPSSTGAAVSYALVSSAYAIAFIVILYGLWQFGASEAAIIYCALPILMVLGFFTIVGALDDVRLAKFGIYAAMGAMFCVRWKPSPLLARTPELAIISSVNIFLGAAVLLGWPPVTSTVARFYSVFFDGLVAQMMDLHKPVLTFGSHAPAAFFLYCFYWLNIRTFQVVGSRLHLGFAIGHAALCAALLSHASFVFAGLAIAELSWLLAKRSIVTALALAGVLFFAVPRIATALDPYLTSWSELGNSARRAVAFVWTEQAGGIGGRFGTGGDMASAIQLIKDRPFLPIGISTKTGELTLGDSGPIEYMVRGSVPLLILIYLGLWFFLKAHLRCWTAIRMFGCIVAMESGFAILTYQRTILLLPAFVAYLAALDRLGDEKNLERV